VTYGTGSITLPTFSVGPASGLTFRTHATPGPPPTRWRSWATCSPSATTSNTNARTHGVRWRRLRLWASRTRGSWTVSARVRPIRRSAGRSLSPRVRRRSYYRLWRRRCRSCGLRHGFAEVPAFTPPSLDDRLVCSGIGTLSVRSPTSTQTATPAVWHDPIPDATRRGSWAAGIAVGQRAVRDGLGDLHLPGRAASSLPSDPSGGLVPTTVRPDERLANLRKREQRDMRARLSATVSER